MRFEALVRGRGERARRARAARARGFQRAHVGFEISPSRDALPDREREPRLVLRDDVRVPDDVHREPQLRRRAVVLREEDVPAYRPDEVVGAVALSLLRAEDGRERGLLARGDDDRVALRHSLRALPGD
eukprot:29570-Pelagococcus_subviridis.AAC.9